MAMTADSLMSMMFGMMPGEKAVQAEAEKDEKQELLERALQCGSGFEGGKVRIRVAVKKWGKNDLKRLEEFLKEEYNVGGHSWGDYFVDYSPSGFVIRRWKHNDEFKYSWKTVARTLVDLEDHSRLFDVPEMQKCYDVYMRCSGYPDPVPRMKYPG